MTTCPPPIQPDVVFEQPWHAQLFATTVALNEAGRFSWVEWTDAFSTTLKRLGVDRELDGCDDYFLAWLETLETLLVSSGAAERNELDAVFEAWRVAFLSTPHGRPVRLSRE